MMIFLPKKLICHFLLFLAKFDASLLFLVQKSKLTCFYAIKVFYNAILDGKKLVGPRKLIVCTFSEIFFDFLLYFHSP